MFKGLVLLPCKFLNMQQITELVHRFEEEDLVREVLVCVFAVRVQSNELRQKVLSKEHMHLHLREEEVLSRESRRYLA